MGAIIMIVYEATKQLFVEDVVQDKIEENNNTNEQVTNTTGIIKCNSDINIDETGI